MRLLANSCKSLIFVIQYRKQSFRMTNFHLPPSPWLSENVIPALENAFSKALFCVNPVSVL